MKLVDELKKNDGQFDYDDFVDDVYAYEHAIKSLIKNKNYVLAYKVLSCYIEQFKEITQCPVVSYRPGYDFLCSHEMFYAYAVMNEKGVKGVVEKNKKEAEYAYLQMLRRYPYVPNHLKPKIVGKCNILLKYAYPDLMDNYSDALYEVGDYFYKKRDYKKAFRFFKKGADFDCDGRQICYPFFLVARNQNKVADMYRYGKGVKKNLKLAKKYYKECAENCGRKRHPKMGDFLLENKEYAKAFLCYTEANPRHPYNHLMWFMIPKDIKKKFKVIFDGIDSKPEKTKLDLTVLAMMYFAGLGCEKNIQKYEEILPESEKWANGWIHSYIFAHLDD